MKEKQELIDWFNNYFDNCYYVKHINYPESIFMFYDVNYIRQLKLAKLEGRELIKNDVTGVCLFELNYDNKRCYADYETIWIYLRDNFIPKYEEILTFINNRLEEHHINSMLVCSTRIRMTLTENFFIG